MNQSLTHLERVKVIAAQTSHLHCGTAVHRNRFYGEIGILTTIVIPIAGTIRIRSFGTMIFNKSHQVQTAKRTERPLRHRIVLRPATTRDDDHCDCQHCTLSIRVLMYSLVLLHIKAT